MNRRAVILAGGKGTRLRPYTVVLPKPLMPIGEFPILEVIIRQLANNGFGHITLAVNHQAELIRAFFQDGQRWGVKIDYSLEDRPLGTMGPLRLINDLPENFLVMNGDVLTDLNFSDFFDWHIQSANLFSVSSKRREHCVDYGVLETDGGSQLKAFREKPRYYFEVSMGIYMVGGEALRFIKPNMLYGFDNLMLDMLAENIRVGVRSFEGYWLDIGRPDDYELAIDTFEQRRDCFLPGKSDDH